MRKTQIVHNPSAGNGKHTQKEIVGLVKNEVRNQVEYVSTKSDSAWKNFKVAEEGDIFIAGGDGTVTKVAEKLVLQAPEHQTLLHLFPHGTANNIAKTLQITSIAERQSLHTETISRYFDCGQIVGCPEKEFFFESLGLGVFPELIFQMRNLGSADSPSEKLRRSLKRLVPIVEKFKASYAVIDVDGLIITGFFILVELMNIQYVGPNLHLAPSADPGDGYFDLVLIPEEKRGEFLIFLAEQAEGSLKSQRLETFAKTMRVKKMKIECADTRIHIDDSIFDRISGDRLQVKVRPKILEFSKNTLD